MTEEQLMAVPMAPENVKDHGDALRAIRNEPFLNSDKWQAQQWRANREGAHPKILEFEDAFIKRMKALGVPMYAHCVVRTFEDQQAAFVRGVSKDSPSDGMWPHRFAAVDIIHSVQQWGMPEKSWDLIGHIGFEVAKARGIAMVWGGDWDGDGRKEGFWDPAHWELAFWRSMEPEPPHMWIGGRKPKG